MGRETWCAAIHGVAKSRTRLNNWTELNTVFLEYWLGRGCWNLLVIVHSVSFFFFSISSLFIILKNCKQYTGLLVQIIMDYTFSIQFSSVTQSCPTLCDPMNSSMPGLPVHHQLPESTQMHVHWVGDTIQPSHPLSSSSPPALNLSQHQGLFKWVSSSHQVAKVLAFQLQHQSFQWTPRTDLL